MLGRLLDGPILLQRYPALSSLVHIQRTSLGIMRWACRSLSPRERAGGEGLLGLAQTPWGPSPSPSPRGRGDMIPCPKRSLDSALGYRSNGKRRSMKLSLRVRLGLLWLVIVVICIAL